MRNNWCGKHWANWKWRGSSSRRWLRISSWLWAACGLGCVAWAQELPWPPGTKPGAGSGELASPKAKELKTSLGTAMISAVAIPTTDALTTVHEPPTAVIRYRFAPAGTGLVDPACTNQVPMRAEREGNAIRIQWLGLANHTYEVQVRFDITDAWLSTGKSPLMKDDLVTSYHLIDFNERQVFFRVMSN